LAAQVMDTGTGLAAGTSLEPMTGCREYGREETGDCEQ
jgi:hypothetical protein